MSIYYKQEKMGTSNYAEEAMLEEEATSPLCSPESLGRKPTGEEAVQRLEGRRRSAARPPALRAGRGRRAGGGARRFHR